MPDPRPTAPPATTRPQDQVPAPTGPRRRVPALRHALRSITGRGATGLLCMQPDFLQSTTGPEDHRPPHGHGSYRTRRPLKPTDPRGRGQAAGPSKLYQHTQQRPERGAHLSRALNTPTQFVERPTQSTPLTHKPHAQTRLHLGAVPLRHSAPPFHPCCMLYVRVPAHKIPPRGPMALPVCLSVCLFAGDCP